MLVSPPWRRWLRGVTLAVLLPAAALAAPPPSSSSEPPRAFAPPVPDTLAERVRACGACHAAQGQSTRDGYFPRIAGKPEGYLFEQLRNFRDGRRRHAGMATLLAPLDDAYLREIAAHFAALSLPYPPVVAAPPTGDAARRGERLVREGDAARGVPACVRCHGAAMTGVAPGVPGLLGLPRDYLAGQLGAWRAGQRQAATPDCMARVAHALDAADVGAVAQWLAAQPVPADSRPAAAPPPGPPLPAAWRCAPPGTPVPAPAAPVDRGETLARAGLCLACHTAPGGAPYAGGRRIATPFGTVVSPNITPDLATGLGRWSAEDFRRAMHEGRSRDGRLLNPAFPYTAYTALTDDDVDALRAHLKRVPAVARPDEADALRFPYGTAPALLAWRALYFTPGRFVPDPSRSAVWNRGAYLAGAVTHCAACHGARNALGGPVGGPSGAGGAAMPGTSWWAPSLTRADQAGVADWPLDDIVALLATGRSPRGGAAAAMAEVVRHGTQHLPPDDLRALATWLKALPAEPVPKRPVSAAPNAPNAPDTPTAALSAGALLYRQHCADCHGAAGEGRRVAGAAAFAYPPLAGSRVVAMDPPSNLLRHIIEGGYGSGAAADRRPFGMPPFGHRLDDAQLAALASWLRQTFGGGAPAVSALQAFQAR